MLFMLFIEEEEERVAVCNAEIANDSTEFMFSSFSSSSLLLRLPSSVDDDDDDENDDDFVR